MSSEKPAESELHFIPLTLSDVEQHDEDITTYCPTAWAGNGQAAHDMGWRFAHTFE